MGGKEEDLSDLKTTGVLEAVKGKYGRGSAGLWDFNPKARDEWQLREVRTSRRQTSRNADTCQRQVRRNTFSV